MRLWAASIFDDFAGVSWLVDAFGREALAPRRLTLHGGRELPSTQPDTVAACAPACSTSARGRSARATSACSGPAPGLG
jgi:hypothetical protein